MGVTSYARMVWGGCLLTMPSAPFAAIGLTPTTTDRMVTRALGARHLLQGAITGRVPPRRRTWLAAIDALHATSMVILAARCPRVRRIAAADGVVALTFAGFTLKGSHA